MKTAIKLIAFAATFAAAGTALAQNGPSRGLAVIPAQFHGRWTSNLAHCSRPPSIENDITVVNARGWGAWEEGGYVVRVGQVRSGTHYFRVINSAGAETDVPGTLALQLRGGRLAMSFNQPDGTPINYLLLRCPRR